MAATDFESVVYSKLKALLLAHAPWTALVLENNRVWMDVDVTDPLANRNWQDGDFPRSVLGVGSFGDTLFNLTPKYAYSPSFNVATENWVERLTYTHILTLTHRDLRVVVNNKLRDETMTAIRKGGPRLGLARIVSFSMSGDRFITASALDDAGNPSGTKRMVTRILLTTIVQLHGNELVV